MKKTFEPLNLIMNSRFVHYYEDCPEEKKQYMVKRVGELSEELKKYQDNQSSLYMYFCNITTSVAALEYDLSKGAVREESIATMERYMQEFMAPTKAKYQKMFQRKWMWPLLRRIIPKLMYSANGEGFHCFTVENKDKDLMFFYEDKCMFNTVLREMNMLDLATIFCRADIFMYGDIPGIKFIRLGTLCNGAENCDFKFIRERQQKKEK